MPSKMPSNAPDLSSFTSTGAWFGMLGSFFEDLHGQFPDDAEVVAAREKTSTASAEEAGDEALDSFLRALGPNGAAKLQAKDPSVFDGLVVEGVDLGRLWKLDMHEQSRGAIFQYLGFLSTVGQTLRSIPPEIMKTIEETAKGLAAQFGAAGGGGGIPDMGSLMNMFSSLGGPGGIGGLLGGIGESTPPRDARRGPNAPRAPKRPLRGPKRT